MSIPKTQLNDNQIKLAQGWLPLGSWPYAYNSKLLWFRDHLGRKNGLKLSSDQLAQLNQLR